MKKFYVPMFLALFCFISFSLISPKITHAAQSITTYLPDFGSNCKVTFHVSSDYNVYPEVNYIDSYVESNGKCSRIYYKLILAFPTYDYQIFTGYFSYLTPTKRFDISKLYTTTEVNAKIYLVTYKTADYTKPTSILPIPLKIHPRGPYAPLSVIIEDEMSELDSD